MADSLMDPTLVRVNTFHGTQAEASPHLIAAATASPDVSKGGLYNQPYHADPNFQPFLFYDLPKSIEEIGMSFCPIICLAWEVGAHELTDVPFILSLSLSIAL
jgi:hypothetical protein